MRSVKGNETLLEVGSHPEFRNSLVMGKNNAFKSTAEWERTSFVIKGWGLKVGRPVWRF